jgi:hypothetical protein
MYAESEGLSKDPKKRLKGEEGIRNRKRERRCN